MVKECVILAGGLGTRLRSSVPDLPKAMAPIDGIPFLYYIVKALQRRGIERFVFALGYKSEAVVDYIESENSPLYQAKDAYAFVFEKELLGTGGAIINAFAACKEANVLVVNGDTFFDVNLQEMADLHQSKSSICTLALKPMTDFDRYGVVTMDANNAIVAFREKQYYAEGLINGGVYLIDKEALMQMNFPKIFSFEKEFLEVSVGKNLLYGFSQNVYFIDIGVPEDYDRAQVELKNYK